jgi:predicted Fe-Mo cluster-binding NifX family protein
MTDDTRTTRVAVPSELPGGLDAQRAGHFGRCACFTLVDIADGGVGEVEVLANAPHGEGGCMSPVLLLAENNVDAVVVTGIGGRPLMGFRQVGIEVLAGSGVDVRSALDAYLAGDLPVVGLEGSCSHH